MNLYEKRFREYLESREDYELIGTYTNNKTKTIFKHKKCGKEYLTTPQNFKKRNCPHCNPNRPKNHDWYVDKIEELFGDEYTVVGKYTKIMDKIEIKHNKCGNTYYPIARDLSTGRGCPFCYGRKKLSEEKAFEEIYDTLGKDYTIIDNYTNSVTPLKIRHEKCGTIYKASHNNIKKNQCKCPRCKYSKGEFIIEYVLKENNVSYVPQKRFDKCKDKYTLPFDFYLPEYNLCIEFQGKQHFEMVEKFGGEKEFKNQQRRDNIKREFCQEENIVLLEIPYWEMGNISLIIQTQLGITNSLNT